MGFGFLKKKTNIEKARDLQRLRMDRFKAEGQASLLRAKQKEITRTRAANKEIFKSSFAFRAIEGFRSIGKQVGAAGSKLSKQKFGASRKNIFFPAFQPRQIVRKKKSMKQDSFF